MKNKKNKKGGAAKKGKAEASKDDPAKDDAAKEETTKEESSKDDTSKDETAAAEGETAESQTADATETEEPTESAEKTDDKAVEDDEKPESATSPASLAQQSKLRSTSFRAGTSGSPLSPDGDTAPDIYRKHVARIEELEKENKRLTKESTDSEKRWKKAEEELADLREAEGDASKGGDEDTDKLVCSSTCRSLPTPYVYLCLVG